MIHGFDDFRIFISAPGDLERDRDACHEVIAEVNSDVAMTAKVLLVTVGLRDQGQIESHRGVVSENVRWSAYFLQIFQDDWGPRDQFRKLFLLAIECRDDPSMPMRDVVVCLRDAPHETDSAILSFRKELEERRDLRVVRYTNLNELKARFAEVCEGWAREAIETASAGRA